MRSMVSFVSYGCYLFVMLPFNDGIELFFVHVC